jgi:hypothetical protein
MESLARKVQIYGKPSPAKVRHNREIAPNLQRFRRYLDECGIADDVERLQRAGINPATLELLPKLKG